MSSFSVLNVSVSDTTTSVRYSCCCDSPCLPCHGMAFPALSRLSILSSPLYVFYKQHNPDESISEEWRGLMLRSWWDVCVKLSEMETMTELSGEGTRSSSMIEKLTVEKLNSSPGTQKVNNTECLEIKIRELTEPLNIRRQQLEVEKHCGGARSSLRELRSQRRRSPDWDR